VIKKGKRPTDDTPYSYKEAISGPYAQKWKNAMSKEVNKLNCLQEMGCWRLVRKSPGVQPIPGRWVYLKKPLDDDTPISGKSFKPKTR
jgi:hypothetical protein